MSFAQKLDFLMRITETSNSALAFHISIDPSLISRLRRGKRIPSKNENYLQAMAFYFSQHCTEPYQIAALANALNIPIEALAQRSKKSGELIHQWLSLEVNSGSQSIGYFLEELNEFKFKQNTALAPDDHTIPPQKLSMAGTVFFDEEGKRKAVLDFLSRVLHTEIRQTLLLYSDESMEWLTTNPIFVKKWTAFLERVIMKGNRIKIVHTVSRDLDEMLNGITKWLPIYMTGAVEPYYCPKKRDGIFLRTLFIAPETAAISANSFGGQTKNIANFLFTEKAVVDSFVEEFNQYLSICRPLMTIYTPRERDKYPEALVSFDNIADNTIIKTNSLTLMTMPLEAALSIHERLAEPFKSTFLQYHEERSNIFKRNLISHPFIELITLPTLQNIRKGICPISFSDIIPEKELHYTRTELMKHLQHLIQLLESYSNYHIYLLHGEESKDYTIYNKENNGVIISKTMIPIATFAIKESNMTAAFWDYLSSHTNGLKNATQNKANVIEELKSILLELSQ